MASRRTTMLGAWVFAALTFGLAPAACIIAPDAVQGPCQKDSDCPDDGIPCTKEACGANGFCTRAPQELPFGDTGCDDQNPCTDDLCQDGACAHTASLSPPTDGNECTSDACENGVAVYTPVKDGTLCGLDMKLQCTAGKCNCTSAEECGASTECLKFACTDNACSSTSVAKGTLVDGLDPGDCLKRVCDGANSIVTVPDTSDVPADTATGNCQKKGCDDQGNVVDIDDPTDKPADDGNPCTDEDCNGGTPVDHTPVADGTECGNGPTCGPVAGGGYQATPHDACTSGVCTPQAPVSCDVYTCDAGNTVCRTACDAGGGCIAGTYCDMGTNACKPVAGIGAACANQGQCAMNTYCVDGVCCNSTCTDTCRRCDLAGNVGICSPIANGQDPDTECSGADACDGAGNCAHPINTACNANPDCLSGNCEDSLCCDAACPGPCQRCDIAGKAGTCSNVDANTPVTGCNGGKVCDGSGGCKSVNGQGCATNGDCLTGFCQDGYCCNSACSGACARCDLPGTIGTCTNVPALQQVSGCNSSQACDGMNNCKKVTGQACSAASECASGFCPSEAGGQKYCCDTACTGNCESCAGGKTTGGVNGTCDYIKANTDPDNECTGTCMANGNGCCDGAGVCN